MTLNEIENVLIEYDYIVIAKVSDFITENPFLKGHEEDLAQEARLLLFRKLQNYDESKSSLATYVRNNTQYACYRYRSDTAKTIIADTVIEELTPDTYMELELETYLPVNAIPSEEHEIVKLKYAGFNQAEIAEMLGTYQQHVSRVLNKNRTLIIDLLY